MDLESVAAELSQVPPATFVTRRAELAKAGREEATGAATQAGASAAEAKAAGRQLADAIKKLGKPSSAAWAVNLLQAQRPHELDAVVELGAEFRAAVAAGDAARLTALSAERRTTLRRVTGAAVELAERALLAPVVAVDDDGRVPEPPGLSPAVSADVEQTLQAVLADPAAEAAVHTGRLVRMLTSNGVEAVDLTDAVSGPFIPPEPDDVEPEDDGAEDDAGGDDAGDGDAERTRSVRSHSSSSSSKSDKSSDSESAASRAAREAARALDDLDHQLDELRELRRRAREQSDRLGDEIADLEARLADLTAELDDRRADRERLEDRLDETDRQFGRLDRERDRAARLAETTARAARR
ncbi:hypothetical protein [Subtercola sp. Z020]|uniref:hypothetical protein n=1 Tax=Subtercola sp. Z020 TaxID=2080582 RepID=UPI00130E4B8B|nr:hypothetical protein [Subtercola sp. Z020]